MKTFRFKTPITSAEETERFVIIEDRDLRVLVECINYKNHAIQPTFVYLKSDLIEA